MSQTQVTTVRKQSSHPESAIDNSQPIIKYRCGLASMGVLRPGNVANSSHVNIMMVEKNIE